MLLKTEQENNKLGKYRFENEKDIRTKPSKK